MALTKRNYVSGETVITAANLNEIQDAIIALEGKGLTKEEVVDALEYTPAKASDIPTTDISANTAAVLLTPHYSSAEPRGQVCTSPTCPLKTPLPASATPSMPPGPGACWSGLMCVLIAMAFTFTAG